MSFIEHPNIIQKHLNGSGIHLNFKDTSTLATNFKDTSTLATNFLSNIKV